MRKYQPIWIELKSKLKARIAAPTPIHTSIVRGVLKEKNLDLGFKVLCTESGKWYRVTYTSKQNILEFTMNEYERFSLGDL